MKQQSIDTVHTHTHGILTKRRIYEIIKLWIFLLILIICLNLIFNITKRKYSYQKISDFLSQEESFDILFLGSSHSFTAVYPMQLWHDYGIVSYNVGQTSSTPAISYYNLLLACKETSPKMIVIDVHMINENYKIHSERIANSMHNAFDPYPISYEKYLAIKELFDGKDLLNNCFEYLFPFSLYHARWNKLEKADFNGSITYEKGAESKINVVDPKKMSDFKDIGTYNKEETVNMQYLRKTIEYCKENDIKILVTFNPYPAMDQEIEASKYVQTICDEYDVNYINFLGMDDIVNYNIDCSDSDSHLNSSGARKVTDYLGKYIVENYDIQDQRENEAYSFWYEDYNEYIDLKINNLKGQEKNLNNYLMLLYDEKDIKYEIKISSKKEIKDGSTLHNLLENLNNNYEIDDSVFEEKQDKGVKITTWDKRDNKKIQEVYF